MIRKQISHFGDNSPSICGLAPWHSCLNEAQFEFWEAPAASACQWLTVVVKYLWNSALSILCNDHHNNSYWWPHHLMGLRSCLVWSLETLSEVSAVRCLKFILFTATTTTWTQNMWITFEMIMCWHNPDPDDDTLVRVWWATQTLGPSLLWQSSDLSPWCPPSGHQTLLTTLMEDKHCQNIHSWCHVSLRKSHEK